MGRLEHCSEISSELELDKYSSDLVDMFFK